MHSRIGHSSTTWLIAGLFFSALALGGCSDDPAPTDTSTDTGVDTAPQDTTGGDATDAGTDTAADTHTDTAADTGTDTAADTVADTAADTVSDTGPSDTVGDTASDTGNGYAPVPAGAFGPAIDQAKGYYSAEISNGIYWVTDGSYQMMFVVTGSGVIVVDAPPSIGDKILTAIAEVTSEAITHAVYSHSHIDHVGSTGLYPSGAQFIAQEETAAILTRAADPNRPVPTITFTDSYTLTVGTHTLELVYPGTNHEPGNIIIHSAAEKVIMMVDVIFPGWVPFKQLALAEDVPGFVKMHDELLTYDWDTMVSGHLGRLGTRDDVTIQRDYVYDVMANAGDALANVDFMAVAGEVGFANQWALFDAYFDAVATWCADLTEPAWVGVLGAADVFTYDHCFKMMESLRIDGPAPGIDPGAPSAGTPTQKTGFPAYVEVPAAAFGPTVDQAKGYFVEEIVASSGVYWVTEGSYQAMFIVTATGVIVVDAPPTINANLLAAITEVTANPITHVIYSHSHIDHIGSANLYPDTAVVIAQEEVAAILTKAADPNRPVPTQTFTDTLTLTEGGQTIELTYPGPNHEPGNSIIYLPDHKIIMVVDVIFPGWVPFKELALAEDVNGFIALHDTILGFDFDHLVSGHVTRLGTKADVTQQKQYITDVVTNAGLALATVDFFAIAGEVGFENQWLLFDTYFDAVTDHCTEATETAWIGVLGAADVFTHDHCFKAMESLRID